MLISLTCDLSSVDSEGRTAAYWAVGTSLIIKSIIIAP